MTSWSHTPLFIASAMCALGLALLAILWGVGEAGDQDAKLLLAALASESCESRLEGISRYSRSEDNGQHCNAALKRLIGGTPAPLKQQVVAVVELMEDGRNGSERILALTQKASQLESLDRGEQDRSLGQLRQELLRIIQSPKESVAARIGASWPLVRILLAASPDHPDWKAEWARSLESMLKSSDSSLRVVGATIAALRRFPEGTDPATSTIVRPLIDGLRHDSVSIRSAAYLGLKQIVQGMGSAVCFGATDPSDRRATATRQWEEWWDNQKEQLARERLTQKFL